jgi:hypothetical protein
MSKEFATIKCDLQCRQECRPDHFRRVHTTFNVNKNVGQILFVDSMQSRMSTRMSARSFSTIQWDIECDNLLLSFSLTEPAIQVDQRERQKNCQTKRNLISQNLIQTKLSQKLWNWTLFWKCQKDIKFNEKPSQVNKCSSWVARF